MIVKVPATAEHCRQMAPRLRPDDVAELLASGFATPLDGLLESLRVSVWAYTVMHDGRPVSMAGIAMESLVGGNAMPWLLTTDDVNAFPLLHTRDARDMLKKLVAEYGHLENYVDARYTKAIRWLKLLGFTVHPAAPLGPRGAAFCRFEMGAA